jgi:hypothetical protein
VGRANGSNLKTALRRGGTGIRIYHDPALAPSLL